jgi:hypothetical protein
VAVGQRIKTARINRRAHRLILYFELKTHWATAVNLNLKV